MNNSKKLLQNFVQRITIPEDAEEISSIGYLVFETIFGISKTEILANRHLELSMEDANRLNEIIRRINLHEPVQYVLGQSEFFGRTFTVNPSVLIPRTETEELIIQVLQYLREKKPKEPSLLDIGTGSGCIPVTLSLEIPQGKIHATDVSDEALNTARRNCLALNAKVNFFNHDILKQELLLKDFDVIVSNPPYISLKEMANMKKNVIEFEPHLALFVADDDALIFYHVISRESLKVLKPGGLLIMEINERFGKEVELIFKDRGFVRVEIVKDIAGKDRFVKGIKPA